MDPTKPILTLNDNYAGCFYRDITAKMPGDNYRSLSLEQKLSRTQQERDFYKGKTAHSSAEMNSLKAYVAELQGKVRYLQSANNNRLGVNSSEEVRVLQQKTDELRATIIQKNHELEEAYLKLQEGGRRMTVLPSLDATGAKRILMSVDRLEDGVKQAIYSNFELLKNNSVNELRALVRSIRQPGFGQIRTRTKFSP